MVSISFPSRLGLIILPSLLLLSGCRSANNYLERGKAAFARGQFQEASLNFRKAIQKDPSFGEAYYRDALAELKQNKAAETLQDLEEAVRLMPDNQAARTDLTNLLLGAYIGDPSHPKFLYNLLVQFSGKWLERDPNSIEGLRIQGYLAMLERRPEEAVEVFRRAHASSPRDEKIVDGLMDALFRANQPSEAERVGLEFLAADKTAADIYDALFRMYVAAHRAPNAENILIRKIEANPGENSYILQLAAFYASAHQKPEMDRAIGKFLSNPGKAARIRVEAGDFYVSVGDLASALEQYRAGSSANDKDKLVYQNRIARVLLLQQNRQQGLQVLNQTLTQYPDDPEARALRAALLVGEPAEGKPGEGIQELRALLGKNPNDLSLKFLLARGLAESQNLAEARSRSLEIIRQRPQFLEARLLLADIAFQQHDLIETLRQAEAALEVDPGNLRARRLKGNALLEQGDLQQAGTVLASLSQQVPQSVDVRLDLAHLSLKKRNYAEAETVFTKILGTNPSEWRAVAGLVDTDLAQNHPEKAFARLEQELIRSHGSPRVRYMLAVTAVQTGKYDDAIENFRELANQTPNSIDALVELAKVYQLKGDVPHAIASLEKAAALQPRDPRPASLLPLLLQSENRPNEAKLVARHALAERPDDTDAMNNLAFFLAQTGESLDEAIQLARQAVSKAPNNPAYLDTLGYVYLKRDQNDDALAIFNNLIRKYPDDPACAYHTGMAWYQKGDRARARTFLAHALDLRPPKDIESAATDLLSRVN